MPDRIAYDSETWLFTPGLMIPPGVVGSFATDSEAWWELFPDAIETLAGCLRPGVQIEGAKIEYDMSVICREAPDLMPAVFDHYDRQGFYDVQHAQALNAVAGGHLFKDPVSRGPLRTAPKPDGTPGKVTKRYSLETCLWLVLGRMDAKENAEFRLRYGELASIPPDQWPEKAKIYPVDDARNTRDLATAQRATFQNLGPLYRVKPFIPADQWEPIQIVWPGTTQKVTLTHTGLNAYAGFALQLLSAWGLRVDPVALRELRARCEKIQAEEVKTFRDANLITEEGKDNGVEIKRRVIRAYRDPSLGDEPCPECAGTGKVPSPKTGNPINCKTCGATGLKVPESVPLTPTGGISADRDTLMNSGDQLLSDFGQSTNAKILDTYLPFLEQGIAAPINVSANVILATGRVSFGKGDDDRDSESAGLLQTFPRKGGVRETIVAPEGWVMCSDDWNALEFANLGQGQLNVCGYSPIVTAINSGKDPHSILGAKMLDISYEEFRAKLKDPATKDAFTNIRQGTKAGNFGFGGRMGAAKFAYTQRKQRIGGHGSMCRLMHREPAGGCGSVSITTWKKRQVPRVCEVCAQVSEEIRLSWLELWELKEYFAWVDSIEGIQDGEGVMITPGTGYIRGGLNVSEGCNHPFQHLGAYGAKLALAAISRECYVNRGTALYGCRPIIMAHDEIITLMPEAYAPEAAARQTELMRWAMRQICPDVEIGIEPALMRRWYKEAEAYWLDPNCNTCGGEGWIYGMSDGKKNRKQCEPCKTNGRLTAWEPMKK